MTRRVKDQIKEIEEYLRELQEVKPREFQEYKEDLKTRLACERCFQKIMEAITDLAFIIVRYKRLETPTDDKRVYEILKEADVLTENLAESLQRARGMRNILAHQYADVDDKIVFEAITEEINTDAQNFLEQVKEKLDLEKSED